MDASLQPKKPETEGRLGLGVNTLFAKKKPEKIELVASDLVLVSGWRFPFVVRGR